MSAAFAEDPCAWMVCHVLAMKSHHDLRGLRNGLGMLRDSWLRFCRTGKCHSVGLRSAILVLLRRMGSIPATSEQFNRDQADRMLQVVASSTETCEDEDDPPFSIVDQPAPHDVPSPVTPTTPVEKTRCENDSTPVSMYLGYFLETGPPSPMCVDDSPHTKRYKSWFSRQLEQEATLVDSAAASSSSSAQPRHSEGGCKGQLLTHTQEDGDEVQVVGHGPSDSSSSTLDPRFHQTSQSEDLEMPVSEDDEDYGLTRYSDLYNSGVASWSQEDPALLSDASGDSVSDFEMVAVANHAVQGSSVLSDDAVKGPLRFRRGKKPSQYKYGYCDVHQKPFKLHLVKSGKHTSELWVRCECFWSRLPSGKPECWKGHPFKGDVDSLPKSVLRAQAKMRKDIKFQVCHGPQTR